MNKQCGSECEIDDEDLADASVAQAMAEVLSAATTEQLRDELRSRGYVVTLGDRP